MTVVERVARAICRANCPAKMSAEGVECQVANGWDLWVPEARAAIEAMRTLSLDVKLAGSCAITAGHMKAMANYDAFCDSWDVAIDAALSERPHDDG